MIGRICIIGGNGFLGSYISDAFTDAKTPVTVFGRSPEKYRNMNPDIRFVSGDFTQSSAIDEALEGADYVVHCLTTVTVHSSNANMVYDIESNLSNTVKLLEKCVEKKIKRIVFVSSGGAVYGPTPICPTPETVIAKPICSYGIVKLAIENYLHLFHHLHGLEYCALRLSNPYGPRQNPEANQGVISVFAAKALNGEPMKIFGDGSAVRDFIHAKDFARAVKVAMTQKEANYIANVGSGSGASLNDIVSTLESQIDHPLDVERTETRSADISKSILDISHFQNLTGWAPQIDIDTGIKDVLGWLRQIGYGK